METLELVPIHLAGRPGLVDDLGSALAASLGCSFRVRPPWFDPECAFDATRGQYSSTMLLSRLLGGGPPRPDRLLGVAGVDLFIPVLTYVFGEAQLDGRAAVVSIHRLQPEVYGLPADERRMFDRLHKEALHELGHTFGLVHCGEPRCVMHASTYVEQIDLKPASFCDGCRAAAIDRQPARRV